MNAKPLELFINPTLLAHINRNILERFLEDMKHCLPPEAAGILAAGLPHEEFCTGLAIQFRSPNAFGAPLRQALCDIETLALPENSSLLDDAIAHLPPGYEVNRNLHPLHQSLHLWVIAQNTPGVTFPISSSPTLFRTLSRTLSQASPESSSSSFSSSSSPPASNPDAHAPPSDAPTPPIQNRKSKIENGSASRQPLSHPEFAEVDPWPDPIAGHVLLDAIVRELSRFVVFPKWAAELFALWIIHTFVYHLRSICTYIALESPEKECGKSTLLTVLSHFVNRPLVSSNITSSAFFRLIEEFNPTLLIDEADTNLRASDDLLGILNAGYARPNAFVWRMIYESTPAEHDSPCSPSPLLLPNNPPIQQSTNPALPNGNGFSNQKSKSKIQKSSRAARFTCWCPKVIASIGRVDDVLASRCIVVRMQRKTEAEECARLKFLDATDLKRQCARFALDHADAIAKADPPIPAGLSNRAADIWEPLFAIADLAGGRWPELARQAAFGLSAQDRSPIGALLLDIFLLFVSNKAERLFSRDIAAALNHYTDRLWADLRKGKALDELWLAKQLRPYGVRPGTIRIGADVAKGYSLDQLKEAFKRYIPRSELDALKSELAEQTASEHNSSPNQPGPDAAPQNSSVNQSVAPTENRNSKIENLHDSHSPENPITPSPQDSTPD